MDKGMSLSLAYVGSSSRSWISGLGSNPRLLVGLEGVSFFLVGVFFFVLTFFLGVRFFFFFGAASSDPLKKTRE